MFLTSLISLIFSDFLYIVKYWNSDRIKFLAESVYVKHASLITVQKLNFCISLGHIQFLITCYT